MSYTPTLIMTRSKIDLLLREGLLVEDGENYRVTGGAFKGVRVLENKPVTFKEYNINYEQNNHDFMSWYRKKKRV